jgi:hypothetical protein
MAVAVAPVAALASRTAGRSSEVELCVYVTSGGGRSYYRAVGLLGWRTHCTWGHGVDGCDARGILLQRCDEGSPMLPLWDVPGLMQLLPPLDPPCTPVLNTGRPRCMDPPFLGVTPPTICVPYWMACSEWKVPFLPVNPWTMTLVVLSTKTAGWWACGGVHAAHMSGQVIKQRGSVQLTCRGIQLTWVDRARAQVGSSSSATLACFNNLQKMK